MTSKLEHGGLQVSVQSRSGRQRRRRQDVPGAEVHAGHVPARTRRHHRRRLHDQDS